MDKINFEDGQLVQAGYVMVGNVKYETVEPVYDGEIPLNATYLNQLQDNIEEDQDRQDTKINALEAEIGDIRYNFR